MKREIRLPVFVNKIEKQKIEEMMKSVSIKTPSKFFRTLGLGFVPQSTLDQQSILKLSKLNSDQARLGNLLKMFLASDKKITYQNEREIEQLLNDIKDVQALLLETVRRL